jgi:hypothetical protein
MPTINLNTRRKPRVDTTAKKNYQNIYHNKKWIDIRNYKMMMFPMCEICEDKGLSELATEVHHIVPFKFGKDDKEIKILAYSYLNTLSVCSKCHKELHKVIDSGSIDTVLMNKILYDLDI